jgi:cell wall-associated NlpC family hydrolase
MPVLRHALRAALLPLALAAGLLATTLVSPPSATAATRVQERIWHGLRIARAQIGDPYRYGAAGPSAFDCSGLVYYSYRKAGFRKVPRTSASQARFMNRIKRRNMRRGDFVFFHNSGGVYHVGVFIGFRDGRRYIVHASRPGTPVKRDPIWTDSWFPGTLRGR